MVPLAEKRKFLKNYYDYFKNIYRCLTLHLKLHFGPNFADHVVKNSSKYSQFQKLETLLAVHRDSSTLHEDLENRCEDPGRILLKVLGRLAAMSSQARKPKVKWTEQMNKDVLECKKNAQELVSSENPPCNENGRKRGYIDVMKDLWDDMGYKKLQLKSPKPTGPGIEVRENKK